MNKAELVEAMAKDAKISKAAAAKALDSFVDNVTKSLKKGKKVLKKEGVPSMAIQSCPSAATWRTTAPSDHRC